MEEKYIITPKDETLTWQNIKDRVKLGFEIQEIDEKLSEDDILKYNDSIIVAPDYQREYRSSISDESSLIESALLQIPIPPIFLANHKLKGVQVLNVVDGQHRLRAFYRFLNNDFKLKDLKILEEFNNCHFKDLELTDRTTLLSRSITAITFRNFPGKEFELEIFNRYNKGTKPLSPQEIRHAVYGSDVNDMINAFCYKLYKDKDSKLSKAYAISTSRFQKKTIHENIFVILSIIENGINQNYTNDRGEKQKIVKSPQYAEFYMKEKSKNSDYSFDLIKEKFSNFNDFISSLTSITEYPFSREIYGIELRGNKFQVSISMILAGIFNKLVNENFNLIYFNSISNVKKFGNLISNLLNNSFLEDPEYKASTTNPIEIEKVVYDFPVLNLTQEDE